VGIILATCNLLQDEIFESATRSYLTILKFQKQKDIAPVAGWAPWQRRKLEEGFNEVEEFQQQNAIVPVAGEWFQEGWVPYVD
jgi:hypothetical protein